MKLELSQQIFGKHLNVKFYENPLSGSTVLLCKWMDGQANIQKWQSWESPFTILWTLLKMNVFAVLLVYRI